MCLLMAVWQYHGDQSSKRHKHVDYPPLEIILPSNMKIILYALHKLKKDALRVIKLSIYHPSSFTLSALEEWSKCYSTSKIKWQFSKSIHKRIFNFNTQEAYWNTSTQRSLFCATRENIIMSMWGETNW